MCAEHRAPSSRLTAELVALMVADGGVEFPDLGGNQTDATAADNFALCVLVGSWFFACKHRKCLYCCSRQHWGIQTGWSGHMRWAHHATPHTAAALPTSGVLVVAGGGWNAVSDGSCCGLGSRPSVDCAPSSAGPNRTGKGALPVCISCSATCVFPILAVQRCLLTIQLDGCA